jgi:signal transduction histidine kinase
MEERAQALGSTLRIASAPGRGTTISLEVPVDGDPRPHR